MKEKKKIKKKKKKRDYTKTFLKCAKSELDIYNVFLVYFLLIKSGILSDQNNSENIKKRPRFARLSTQALPIYICETQQTSYFLIYLYNYTICFLSSKVSQN